MVHPTRTRHGYPAFLCSRDLYVTVESEDILHNVTIPSKSFLVVQNNQYVESEQVIAEIRAGTSTFNLKERIQKHIYSDSGGEMHWSTDVYHAPKFPYGNVHLLLKPSHLWILSGGPCRFSIASFSLHKDQDQMNAYSVSRRDILNSSLTNDQTRHKLFRSGFSGKKENRIPDYSELNRIVGTGHSNLIDPVLLHNNLELLAKRRSNRLIIPLQLIQEREKELMPSSCISIDIPINGIFHRNSILAYFDDPRYVRKSSGITFTKYEALEGDSIVKKEDLIEYEYREVTEFGPKDEMKVDRFFFIPEEVHRLPRSSSIMVRNNSIVGVDTQITLNTRSRVGGLVRVERKKKRIELQIFSVDIHFPGETDKISQHGGVLIPPGIGKRNFQVSKKCQNWIYVQPITPTEKPITPTEKPITPAEKPITPKKYFILIRPVITYEIMDFINFKIPFPPDMLQERDNVQLQVINYIRYGNVKPIRVICNTSIQLVRTCLVLNWDQDKNNSSIEEAHASFVEIRTNGLIRDFLRINLVKSSISYTEKRNDPSGSEWLSDNGSDRTNINPFFSTFFYSKAKMQIQQSINQNQGTVHTLLNRNKDCQSFLILSSSDCSRMGPFNDGKSSNVIKESIRKNLLMPIRNSLGPVGTAFPIANFYSFYYYLITYNQIWGTNYLQLDNFKETFQVLKYYFMDENGKIYNANPCSNIVLNPFNLNWYFLYHNYCEKTSIKTSLGQFIGENVCIAKNGPHLKSGQVLIVQGDSIVIRSVKLYFTTPGTTINGHYGEILYDGDILITFLYEKSRSSDITQGLPKVEKMFEARSIDSISMNLAKRVEGWNECITKILGIPWGFLIGAELTIMQSRISLVNKIQEVYRSQGVQLHNRHIELIVRQITSKVLVSEDGMSSVFLPGELIGLLRAERMGRALEEAIHYRAVLLGITRASLNTQSFVSEASFQETARVLSKAALRGRIDWVKGLKENVVLGGMIPVGTGFKGLIPPLRHHNNIPLETKKQNRFEGEMRETFFHSIKII